MAFGRSTWLPRAATMPPGCRGILAPPMPLDMAAIRKRNAGRLRRAGFRFAQNLPTRKRRRLRSRAEIARRLAALSALVSYVCAPPDKVPTTRIRAMIRDHDLDESLTESEAAILRLRRATARNRHLHTIGWRMENMLVLAWVLGNKLAPRIDGAMLDGEELHQVVREFSPLDSEACTRLLAAKTIRPFEKIAEMEDLFYCAHNAARNAAYKNEECLPPGFDDWLGLGVVQERRHALTWVLSAGTAWDATDLST